MIPISVLNALNQTDKTLRLEALKKQIDVTTFIAPSPQYINNHIHTKYSFSPYSPTAAVFAAKSEGLSTAGIVDHDSISGAQEFLEAGKIANFMVTCGMECRVSMQGTPFEKSRLNNPDQVGIAYMAIHGVPQKSFQKIDDYFKPLRENRNKRNRLMVDKINTLFKPYGINLDFDTDIYPLSYAKDGGSVTERHLMYGLSLALTKQFGKGQAIIDFFDEIKIDLNENQKASLLDVDYDFYEYDILNILKSQLIERIYIPATDECPSLTDIIAFTKEMDAILSYAYLGDIAESVTGDKKAQVFEDAYLTKLFDYLNQVGVEAVSYMPTRNTPKQLERIKQLCDQYNMYQISGEDINTPRQSFVCKAMDNPEFNNLIQSTWALIAHENLANKDSNLAFLSPEMKSKYPKVKDRIEWFSEQAKNFFPNK